MGASSSPSGLKVLQGSSFPDTQVRFQPHDCDLFWPLGWEQKWPVSPGGGRESCSVTPQEL